MRKLALALFGLGLCFVQVSLGTEKTVPVLDRHFRPTSNGGVVEISDPSRFSKVYVISDVHGMYGSLLTLFKSTGLVDRDLNWKAGNALLLVLGDSIDKGAQSIDVIDFWIALTAQASRAGGRVIHLLGNHEAEFLSDPSNDEKAKAFIEELRQRKIPLKEVTQVGYPRADFLRSLPVAARVGNWLFCHSGFIEESQFDEFKKLAINALQSGNYTSPFLLGESSVLEAKDWWESGSDTRKELLDRLTSNHLLGVVFGHQPSALNVKGRVAVSDDFRLIKVDQGMAPQAGGHPGGFLVFEFPHEMTLMVSPQISEIQSGSSIHQGVVPEVTGAILEHQEE